MSIELSTIAKAWEREELLALSRQQKLTHKGRPLSVDIWTVLQPVVELGAGPARMRLDETETGSRARGYVDAADWVGTDWILFGRVLYALPEGAEEWIAPRSCSEEAIREWRRDWPIEGQWTPKTEPHLILRDVTGRFVQLMERVEGQLRVAAPQSSWSKDLLELGYQKLPGGEFACDPAQAGELLHLLLSCGWTAALRTGGPVCLLESKQLEMGAHGDLHGTLQFQGGHALALEEVLEQKNTLLRLPEGWGLLPPDPLLKACVLEHGQVRLRRDVGTRCPREGLELSPEAHVWWGDHLPTAPDAKFSGVLRPYQEEGRRWILAHYQRGGGGILADEMGLGKTVQVLAALSHLHGPMLILVPTSLLSNWQREIARFLPKSKLLVYHGHARMRPTEEQLQDLIVLTSYGLVRTEPWMQAVSWEAIICDEAHLLKSRDAQVTQAVHALRGRLRLAVTGTPLENHPEELRTQISFFEPDSLLDAATWNAAFSSAHGKAVLRRHLEPLLLRRRKLEVAPELPPLLEQEVWLDLSPEQAEVHEALRAEARLHDMTVFQVLERLMRMRQLCCSPQLIGGVEPGPKLELLCADLAELLEAGHSVLVFSQFASFLELARRHCDAPSLLLTGATRDRAQIVERFQSGESRLLMATLKAGGVGLNLQRADVVILLEPWWNRSAEQQAIDRAHRIGRTEKVLVRRYLMASSIEEKVQMLQQKKLEWGAAIWGDQVGGAAEITLQDLQHLLD